MAEYHPLRTNDQNPTTAAYAQHNADAERRAKECRSAQMPSLKHLRMRDYDTVYEPSDDTYLLIDAIGMDMDAMMMGRKGGEGEEPSEHHDTVVDGLVERDHAVINTTLEIGCGTGVPSVYLAMRLRGMADDNDGDGRRNEVANDTIPANARKEGDENNSADITIITTATNPLHYVTDINSDAIRIAKSTAEKNGIPVPDFQTHQCDLASTLLETLTNKVDILIFNPPYVPTPDVEVGSSGIEASWAGGTNGRIVLDRALPQVAQLLAYPHGVAYVVVVDDNFPEEVARAMDERYGVRVVPWMRRRARNEFLTILKMTPTRQFCDGHVEGRDIGDVLK